MAEFAQFAGQPFATVVGRLGSKTPAAAFMFELARDEQLDFSGRGGVTPRNGPWFIPLKVIRILTGHTNGDLVNKATVVYLPVIKELEEMGLVKPMPWSEHRYKSQTDWVLYTLWRIGLTKEGFLVWRANRLALGFQDSIHG